MVDLLEALIDKLEEGAPAPQVTVKPAEVKAPDVHVAAPVVNVAQPAPSRQPWTFTVNRDSEGRIETITAVPKS